MSLHRTLELHQHALQEQLTCSEDCSERLKALEGPSENHKIPTSRAASAATTTGIRSVSIDRDGSNHRRSSFSSFEDSSTPRGRSSLRSVGADQSQVFCQTLGTHQDAVIPKSPNQDQKVTARKDSIYALDIFNQLVQGCNVLERLSTDSSKCLATNKGTFQRCTRRICKRKERSNIAQKISQYLVELTKIYVTCEELVSVKSHLRNFVSLAICSRSHRQEYHAAIDNVDQYYLCSISGHMDENLSAGSQDQCAETTNTDSPATDSISALAEFNEIFPQAKQWFDNVPNKCLWRKTTKTPNDRCNNRIAATHKNMIDERFEKLRNICFRQRILEASQCIGELADLAFCSRYHCRKARARIQESLAGSLLQSHGQSILSSIKCEGEDEVSQESIDRLQNMSLFRQGARSANNLTILFPDPADDRYNFSREAVTRRASRTLYAYIPKLVRYETKESRAVVDHGEWILEQANREFTKQELDAGYIYAYWNRTVFGAYKIGYTTRNVDERLIEWESKCKHEAERVYPPHHEVAALVPHAKRVERLIHADLRKCRFVELGCHGCYRSHCEWFKGLNESLLKSKIEKWTDWMMSEPYEHLRGNLVLRKSAEDTLREMCREIVNNQTNVSLQVLETNLPRRKLNSRSEGNVCDAVRRRSQLPSKAGRKYLKNSPASHRYNLRSRRMLAQ